MKFNAIAFQSLLVLLLLFLPYLPKNITTTSYEIEKTLPNSIIHKTYISNAYLNNTEIFHGYYSWPQFPPSIPSASRLNSYYQEQFFQDYEEMKNIRLNSAERISPQDVYAYDHTFEVTFLSNQLLSILEDTYLFSGGAQPEIKNEAHTFSLSTGKELNLSDLFSSSKNDIDKWIKDIITKEIRKAPNNYYPDAEKIIQDISLENFNFYISKNGIVVFFNPAEIAPYAGGIVKFLISI